MSGKGSRAAWLAGILTASVAAGVLTGTPAHAVVGDEAQEGQYPFTAKIHIGDGERICSGTLVDPRWILTAASCFADSPQEGSKVTAGTPKKKASVSLDSADLPNFRNPVATRIMTVEIVELVPHENRDLVMARVSSEQISSGPFAPKLASPFSRPKPIAVGTTAPVKGEGLRSSGFGRTKDEWVPDRMHAAAFTVESVQNGSFNIAGKSPSGAGICQGDAGSPIFRENEGRFELVGINSTSSQGGCFGSAEGRNEAVGTRVDDVNSWIQRTRLASMYKDVLHKGAKNPLDRANKGTTDVVTSADFNGDGRPDVAAVMGDGNLYAFYTASDGKLEYGRELWAHDASWPKMQKIIGGDFNGDGVADIAAITYDGSLRLYPGKKDGPLGEPLTMWRDNTWDGMPHVARYKADSSGRDGLLAITKDGSLYAYTTGSDGVLLDSRREMWRDKTWFKKHITTGDFNGDGRDDIAAIANNGAMHLYRGNAQGTFDDGTYMWRDNTWDTYRAMMGGDFNRDGKSDIAAINGSGDLYLYPGKDDGMLGERSLMWPTGS